MSVQPKTLIRPPVMPAKGEDEQEAARVFYVAATRATQRLVIGVGGDGQRRDFAYYSLSSNVQPDEQRIFLSNEHTTKFANAINLFSK